MNLLGLKNPVATATRYLRSPRVTTWKKLLGLLALIYAASPIDAIPDFLPVIGWLDDLGVVGAVTWYLVRDLKRFEQEVPERDV